MVALALLLGACGGSGRIQLTAHFDDAGDLAPAAPVMLSDVQIGKVEEIELADGRAMIVMSIDEGVEVPQGVIARIRRTSLLGERIVDFEIPEDLPPGGPALQDGAVIEETITRPDLEDLVREGTHVLTPIAASEVATLVHEGAEGFGGQGEELGVLLDNFAHIVRAYSGRTTQIRSVVESLDRFNRILGQQVEAHSRSVTNSARAIRVLREETDQLDVTLQALDRLSRGGRWILERHSDEMAHFFRQMRVILNVLRDEQHNIVRLLRWAPYHNRNTQWTEFHDWVQVYQDFIFCGLNEDDQDRARNCKGTTEP